MGFWWFFILGCWCWLIICLVWYWVWWVWFLMWGGLLLIFCRVKVGCVSWNLGYGRWCCKYCGKLRMCVWILLVLMRWCEGWVVYWWFLIKCLGWWISFIRVVWWIFWMCCWCRRFICGIWICLIRLSVNMCLWWWCCIGYLGVGGVGMRWWVGCGWKLKLW